MVTADAGTGQGETRALRAWRPVRFRRRGRKALAVKLRMIKAQPTITLNAMNGVSTKKGNFKGYSYGYKEE